MTRIIAPFIAMLAATAILVGLGTWQVQRLGWKEGLIAQIEARVTAAPVAPDEVETRLKRGDAVEYTRLTATGRFAHERTLYLYQIGAGGPGWHVYTPLEQADDRVLLVNRGYVPLERRDPATRADGLSQGVVTVTGLARTAARKGLFTPDNDRAANEWYWRDIAGMVDAAYPDGTPDAFAFVLEAEAAPANAGDTPQWPQGGVTLLDLPNKHFGYALTWFGLAATCLGVGGVFISRRLRRKS